MHALLENEHQKLIDLLDTLDECISKGYSANQVHKYLTEFVALAEEHFENEKIIMETYNYPDIASHKKEHDNLLEELFLLRDKLGQGHTPFGKEYMRLLRTWLTEHLFGPDSRLDKFLQEAAGDGGF